MVPVLATQHYSQAERTDFSFETSVSGTSEADLRRFGSGATIHVASVLSRSSCTNSAWLHVHDAEQPALVVTDVKLGSFQRGGVGLWIESGTVGYFCNLQIIPER
jgi:hypothetical protein